MTLYLVIQSAIYRHGIGGVFTTLDGAKACADQLAATDIDDHHEYAVVPIAADTILPWVPSDDQWEYVRRIHEAEEVYVTQQGKPPRTNHPHGYPIV